MSLYVKLPQLIAGMSARAGLKQIAQGNTESILKTVSKNALRRKLFSEIVNDDGEVEGVFNMQNVQSSNVSAIGYNRKSKTLKVRFHGGREYYYRGVSEYVFKSMLESSSKGKFMWRKIRPSYPFYK